MNDWGWRDGAWYGRTSHRAYFSGHIRHFDRLRIVDWGRRQILRRLATWIRKQRYYMQHNWICARQLDIDPISVERIEVGLDTSIHLDACVDERLCSLAATRTGNLGQFFL